MAQDTKTDPSLVSAAAVEDVCNGEMASQVQQDPDTIERDAVFGEIKADGPNYRNVGWIGTSFIMMKTQIGLGVLSFPHVFNVLGIVPGVLLLCAVGGITTWSNYIVGIFKLKHRQVYSIDDAGHLIFGRIGKEFLAFSFIGHYTMTAGSAMLSLSIAFNALSDHGACTAVFVAVAFILVFILSSIRTLGRMMWLTLVGVVSIITAVIMITIAVAVQDRPAEAPPGPWKSDYKVIGNPSFTDAVSAVSAIIFAYAGTGAFFPIVSEMRDPRHYTKALAVCQSVISAIYILVGVLVYYYVGSYVSSPALGSAGPTMKKASYGVAFCGLLVTGILLAHVTSKYIFVRTLRGTKHLTSNTFVHWCTWLGCTFGICLIAYILASAIPVFNGIVSLSGALFGTLQSFQPMGAMWLYDNWKRPERGWKWKSGVVWSSFVITSGTFIMIAGTYGSIVSIIESYNEDGGVAAWSCADNSGSS